MFFLMIKMPGADQSAMKHHDKVIKSRTQWRKQNQVKKIKILLTIVLVFLCVSIAAGAVLAWAHIRGITELAKKQAHPVSQVTVESGDSLPVYEDSLNLLLVNSSQGLPQNYQVQNEEYLGVSADKRILPALKKMMGDAEAAGCPLKLKGGYVDSKTQDDRFNSMAQKLIKEQRLSQVRAENQAQTTVGRGGYNENQTGLAVEFVAEGQKSGSNFAETASYRWLIQNSVSYGFILRFPQDKESATGMSFSPSHFRYVGSSNAVKMRELSMCLEEYVPYIAKQSGQ